MIAYEFWMLVESVKVCVYVYVCVCVYIYIYIYIIIYFNRGMVKIT